MPVLKSSNILSTNCYETGYIECYIASWIWKIVPFILVVIGVIGNTLSSIVLSSPQLRKKSTCVYLRFLAVTDTIVLCTAPWLHTLKNVFGTNVWYSSSFSCSVIGWMVYTSGMISCWLIVAITAERTLLALFPISAKPKMTPRNAVIASVSLSVLFILLNGHYIYGSTIVERQVNTTKDNVTSIQIIRSCSLRQGMYSDFYEKVWTKLLLVIGSVLPIILIVTGNAIVAISLIKSRRALRRVQHSDGRVRGQTNQLSSRSKANYKLFFLLCGVYIMTTVPYGIYINMFPFDQMVDDHTLAKYQLAAVIIRCLIWSNFSFNFLLYFLTGSLFRKEVKRLFESAQRYFNSVTSRSSVQPQTDQDI